MKRNINMGRRHVVAASVLALSPTARASTASVENSAVASQRPAVSDMSALRASMAPASASMVLAGYYAPGDGGGGTFVHDASDNITPDDGGTVIAAANGGRWKRLRLDDLTVRSFGARGDGSADDGPAISAAHAFASSRRSELVFPGGLYAIGPATSFTLDPLTVRWRAAGVALLRWTEAPHSGCAVQIVSSAKRAYQTGSQMTAKVFDGIQILGGPSASTRHGATGLRMGNGVNHTFGIEISGLVVQGFTTLLEFTDNVWWITLHKPRLLWGRIDTPASPKNFGENMTWYDAQFLDGVLYTIHDGDVRLYGGSCDNSSVVVQGTAQVAWHGAHFENPGNPDLARPFVEVLGAESSVQLTAAVLVINPGNTPIRQSPFAIAPENQLNGLIIDGLQFTQGPHAGWFSIVAGSGRVRVRNPQILAFSNQHYQVFAQNADGKLRNAGFENGNLDGWSVNVYGDASAVCTNARSHLGNQACLLRASGDGFASITLAQKVAIRAGEMLMMKLAYSRAYVSGAGVLTGQLVWLDVDGTELATAKLNYTKAPSGTDDGAVWLSYAFNGTAPAGTAAADLQIQFQRPGGTGNTSVYIDDVTVNVV